MIGRNRRGDRRASWKMRVSIAAAVLAGGGAIGAVAIAANGGSASTAAQSAGYNYATGGGNSGGGNWMSPQQGFTQVFTSTTVSVTNTISVIHQIQPFSNTWNGWQGKTQFAAQRGIVVAVIPHKAVAVRSANGKVEWWGLTGGTKLINVGGNSMGIQALRGWSSMNGGNGNGWQNWYGSWNNKTLKKGDVVFIAGIKVRGVLFAKVILFAHPRSFSNMRSLPFSYNTGMTPSFSSVPSTFSNGMTSNTFNATNGVATTTPSGANQTVVNGQVVESGTNS